MITFRPLLAWPGVPTPPAHRKRSSFNSRWLYTLDLLGRELNAINAREVSVQIDIDARDITRGGFPRAGATPHGPGVVLSFSRADPAAFPARARLEPFAFPCDTFDEWRDNTRAIALALEALRKVDRYGVTARGEQYRGFAQLPAASVGEKDRDKIGAFWVGTAPEWRRAAEVLLRFANLHPPESPDALQYDGRLVAYVIKRARARAHPDAGGSAEAFIEVDQAAAVMIAHMQKGGLDVGS